MQGQGGTERTSIGVIEYIGSEAQQAMYGRMGVLCILGARAWLHEDADIVFEAWHQAVREHDQWKSEQHYLMAKADGGRPEWGIARMEAILARNPGDDIARIGVGLAMLLGSMDDWQEHIDHVLATSKDPYARKVALKTKNVVAVNRRKAGWLPASLQPA